MKITTTETVDVEVEVEVGIMEVTQALQDCLRVLETRPDQIGAIHQLLNTVYVTIAGVDASMIQILTPSIRDIIATSLREQAERFAPETV